MFRISIFLIILLVFSCWAEVQSKSSLEKIPHPIFRPFERNCTENKDKKLSFKAVSQILKLHSRWLENPSPSDANRAKFCGAVLTSADLEMAMLAGANFREAILHNANLKRANLTRANFSGAELLGAMLNEAMLHLAVFQGTKLAGASLEGAMLHQANLRGVDLTKVIGLTQPQINMACLDKETKLPHHLSLPKPCS